VQRTVQRFGGALVLSAAALGASVALGPVIGRSAFVVFHIAVVLSAFFWGLGPGLLTGILGVVSIDYFLLGAPTSLRIESASDFIILLAFSVAAVTTSALTQRLRTARSRAEEMNESLQRAMEEADTANAAKSQFLATMSHEIRTPINAVLGFAELLDLDIGGPLTPQQREYVRRIIASSRHLGGLVSDVLDLSRIEAGYIVVANSTGELEPAVQRAVALVKPLADARQIELVAQQCITGTNASYSGDPQRVEQILVNLLSNAVKFTGRGGRVTVSCAVVKSLSEVGQAGDGVGQWVCVQVSDTGIGIAEDQLERIFDPFVQVRSGLSDRAPGSGLGLAISRHLVRLMRGELTVASAVGVGTTFTLWLRTPLDYQAPALPGDNGAVALATGDNTAQAEHPAAARH
jgi:signal transduction histidine kinase